MPADLSARSDADSSSSLEGLRDELLAAIAGAADLADLDATRIGALGRNGRVTGLMKTLGGLPPEERRARGQAFNLLKDELAQAIETRRQALLEADLESRLERERIDVSLPARTAQVGTIHPISRTIE